MTQRNGWRYACFYPGKLRDERGILVPKAGFEPARVTPHAPQTCVSTRFHHFGTDIYATTKIGGFSSRMCGRLYYSMNKSIYVMSCLLTLIFICFLSPSMYD